MEWPSLRPSSRLIIWKKFRSKISLRNQIIKYVSRAERMELNQWANSERHGYMLNCEYDYSAHLVSGNKTSFIY